MPDTITALFKDEAEAESAIRALEEANFDRGSTELRGPEDAEVPDFGGNAARGVAIGSIADPVNQRIDTTVGDWKENMQSTARLLRQGSP